MSNFVSVGRNCSSSFIEYFKIGLQRAEEYHKVTVALYYHCLYYVSTSQPINTRAFRPLMMRTQTRTEMPLLLATLIAYYLVCLIYFPGTLSSTPLPSVEAMTPSASVLEFTSRSFISERTPGNERAICPA